MVEGKESAVQRGAQCGSAPKPIALDPNKHKQPSGKRRCACLRLRICQQSWGPPTPITKKCNG